MHRRHTPQPRTHVRDGIVTCARIASLAFSCRLCALARFRWIATNIILASGKISFFFIKKYIYIFYGPMEILWYLGESFSFFFFFTSCIVVSYRFLWYKFQKRDECIEDIKDRKLSIDSIYSSLFLIIRVRMNKNLLVITNIRKIYLFGTWVVSLEECFN